MLKLDALFAFRCLETRVFTYLGPELLLPLVRLVSIG